MIIDAHTHGFNGRNIDRIAAAGGEWTRQVLATYLERRRDKPQAVNVALRVEMLDRNHIDLQVVKYE